MGMSQAVVGKQSNLDMSQIGRILSNFGTKVFQTLKIGLTKGKSCEQLATENQLHTLTPNITHLENKKDEKSIEIFLI